MQHIHEENLEWEGETYHSLLYECCDNNVIKNLSPIAQVQAICFTDQGEVVIYKDYKGKYGLPGGTVEEGETLEEALVREGREEAGVHITSSKPIGYEEVRSHSDPNTVFYQARYVSSVYFSKEDQINDPDKKAVERVIVPADQAPAYLNWGEKGGILLNMAQKVAKQG